MAEEKKETLQEIKLGPDCGPSKVPSLPTHESMKNSRPGKKMPMPEKMPNKGMGTKKTY